MSWSRNEVTLLIEEYRKWPNLYKVSSINYKNRNLRQQSLEAIQNAIQTIKPGVSTLEILTKFQALKQNAIRQYKKWKNSLKSGAGDDEVYKPSLWYYNLISFVFENSEPRETQDTLNHVSEEYMTSSDVEDTENVLCGMESPDGSLIFEQVPEHCESPLPCFSPVSSTSHNIQPQRKKLKQNNKDEQFLSTLSKSLESISSQLITSPQVPQQTSTSENQHFCNFLVQKLDRISDENIRGDTQERILAIVNKAIKKCTELNQ